MKYLKRFWALSLFMSLVFVGISCSAEQPVDPDLFDLVYSVDKYPHENVAGTITYGAHLVVQFQSASEELGNQEGYRWIINGVEQPIEVEQDTVYIYRNIIVTNINKGIVEVEMPSIYQIKSQQKLE